MFTAVSYTIAFVLVNASKLFNKALVHVDMHYMWTHALHVYMWTHAMLDEAI